MIAGPKRFFLIAFILAGGVMGYLMGETGDFDYREVLITIEASIPAETQLFYDTGRGFNEHDSIRKTIYQANTPITLTYEFSGPVLKGLRFDPSRSPARIKIHEILLRYQDENPFSIPLDSLLAINDIKSVHYHGKTMIIETTGTAQDPVLHLSQIGPAPHPSGERAIRHTLGGAFVALIIAFFVPWAYRNSLELRT